MLEIYNPYAIAAISALGGFLFGTDISSVSAFLDVDSYLIYFNHPNDTTQGGITAAMPAGAFVGALVAGPVSNRLGRKKSIILSTVCWTIGCILSCAAQNVPMLVVGRFIKGICVGWTSGQVPVYLAEQSPRAIRGRLVGTQQIAITVGILVMFYVSYGCSFIKGVTSFRLAWGLQLVPGALLGLLLPLCPESCRWLASRGRMEEAEQVIAKIHNLPLDSAEVQLQMDEIREALRIEKESAEIGYSDLFKKKLLSRTIAGMSCQLWRDLCGVNVMMYYVVYVFQMAGLTGNTNLISSSIQYVINFAMTIPALIWVDKWGRRPTLLVGSALMAAFLFATAGLLANYGHYVPDVEGNENVRWSVSGPPSKAVIACSYLFVASFAITWGPVSWIYVSEIFPRPVRAQGSGLATATNWIMNFALSFFVPPAFKNIQWKTYLVFGVFCVASFIQVFFTFHETKGRSLEEISTLFETSITPFSKKATLYPSPNDSSHHDDLKEHIVASE
ncbi:general substrate transporter [Armillaria mellea]|nr:general substrate transporter [Armillaria mellea]